MYINPVSTRLTNCTFLPASEKKTKHSVKVNMLLTTFSPGSKRRLAELSHELSLAQKISLGSMWLLAAFFGATACFPEKVTQSNKHCQGSCEPLRLG